MTQKAEKLRKKIGFEGFGTRGKKSSIISITTTSSISEQPLCKYRFHPQKSQLFQVAPPLSATTETVVMKFSHQPYNFYDGVGGSVSTANVDYQLLTRPLPKA